VKIALKLAEARALNAQLSRSATRAPELAKDSSLLQPLQNAPTAVLTARIVKAMELESVIGGLVILALV